MYICSIEIETMTDTSTNNNKQSSQERLRLSIASTNRRAEQFRKSQTEFESIIRGFFNDISSKCDYFILKETDMNESFGVWHTVSDETGNPNTDRFVQVGSIDVNYKYLEIKLKPNLCKVNVRVIVDEHITKPKGSHVKVNQGYKISISINHIDSRKYKTGGSIIKLIEEQIKKEEIQRIHNEKLMFKRELVKKELSKLFPFKTIYTLTECKEYLIKFGFSENTTLKVKTSIDVNNNVSVHPASIEFKDNVSLLNVIKCLEVI